MGLLRLRVGETSDLGVLKKTNVCELHDLGQDLRQRDGLLGTQGAVGQMNSL